MDLDTLIREHSSGEPLTAHADGDYPPFDGLLPAPSLQETIDAWEAIGPDDIGLSRSGELEPGIRLAFDVSIAALTAVAKSKLSLQMQGDPKGLMSGDGSSDEEPETNAPTAHRVGGRGMFDCPKSKDAPWRQLPVVEAMARRCQINKDEAQAMISAASRFYRDFILGNRNPTLTAKYGDMTGGSGTPLSQQTVRYWTDKNGVEREELSPEERRAYHHTNWINACHAIGVHKDRITGAPRMGIVLVWMQRLICEDYSYVSEKTPTLEDAGRAYTGHKCAKQAMGAGVAMIKGGLERLVAHYAKVDR